MAESSWPCCRGENLVEEYYGYRCRVCDTLIPFGCEPWAPMDDDDTPCAYCGEEGCEASCTGALLAREDPSDA